MAILAGEMLGLLMLMKDDFIVEDFVAIVAEWLKIAEISFFSSHFRNKIKKKYIINSKKKKKI